MESKNASQLIEIIRNGKGEKRKTALENLSMLTDKETVQLISEALSKALKDGQTAAFGNRLVGNFGNLGLGRDLALSGTASMLENAKQNFGDYSEVLVNIGTKEAFTVLLTFYQNGQKNLREKILQFGKMGEQALRPRNIFEILFGLRKLAE